MRKETGQPALSCFMIEYELRLYIGVSLMLFFDEMKDARGHDLDVLRKLFLRDAKPIERVIAG